MTSFKPPTYGNPTMGYKYTFAAGAVPTLMERARIAVKSRNHAEAAQCFKQILQKTPENPYALIGLGQALCHLGRRTEGTTCLRKGGQYILEQARKSGDIRQLLEVTSTLQHWSDYEGALDTGRQATEIDAASFHGHRLLAITYSQLNRTTDALQAGQQALALEPRNDMMHIFQASLEADAGLHAAARLRLEDVLTHELNPREEFRAHKELARVLDKLGDHAQVFPHLRAAADCSGKLPEINAQDRSLIPGMIKANTAGFDRELMNRWAGSAFPAHRAPPVFVLGFMRSGTTLTQEVLDTHPGVLVADEAGFIWAMQRELHSMDQSTDDTAAKLKRLDFAGVLHLRDFYWQQVHQRFGDTLGERLFVDKFTMNTIDLGLINVVFPDARVVFVVRDPRDICLSCFMQLMVPTPTTVHLLTWQGTIDFYVMVMKWWMYIKQHMTLDYIEFRYEDAVTQFEPTFRRILDFLGLPWDAGISEFHKHAARKYIATPSRSQVAQPLYSSSLERWRNFESEFAPVSGSLDPFISAFGYQPFQKRTNGSAL